MDSLPQILLSQKKPVLLQKLKEIKVNFYHLGPIHAAHILHLIPNAQSKSPTNTEKGLLTPQPLCFLMDNSLIPGLPSLVLMTFTQGSEPTEVRRGNELQVEGR